MKYFLIISYLCIFGVNADDKGITQQLHFSSIEYLVEQEVGRIVLPQIYKNIGLSIEISPLPGKRAQFVASNGIRDGEIMRIWTYGDENPTTIRVPTPYYYLETMPFIAKQRNISIEEASDLQHYSIVKVRGVKHTNNITKGLSNVYEANSTDNMLRLVETGQVDIALTNTIDGILALKKLGISNVTPLKKPLAVLPLYHYLHEKHKALVPIIDQEIRRLKASGELATLIQNAENKIIKNLPLLPKRELN